MKYLILLFVLVQNFVFGQNLIGCKVMPSNSTTTSTSVKRSSNTLMDNYDVKYYNIDLNVSNTSLAINGFVQMKAQAKKDGFNQVVLNLANTFTVDSVYINGKRVTYSKSGDELTIQATTNFSKNQYFESIVYYRGNGSAGVDFPAGMNLGVEGNKSYLYTVSEPYHSYLWWPCKQDLLDKADSAAINITTKGTNLVASNGLLQKTTTIGADKRFEWKTRYPIAYYLLTFSAGPYVEYKTYANPAGFSKPILIQAFLYDQAYLNSNKSVIDQTALLIEKFSEKFGLYPFAEEKYGYYTAPFKYGALENQTMTMMNGFNFDLVAHELSHQWFGNNVTCTDWSQIWLHEGMADFCESVANELVYGESSRQSSISYSQTKVLATPLNCATIKDTHIPGNIFNKANAYSKGATVMNMLRFEIGEDTTFFGMLKAYQKKYAGRNANTDSLSLFIKGYTGKDFSTFFNQWIVGTGFPNYTFTSYQRGDTLYVNSMQTTSSTLTPLYAMKMDFNLVNSTGGVTYVTAYQNKSNETFKFLVKNQRITSVKPNPKLWSLYTNHSGSSISVSSGDNFITAFSIPGALSSTITETNIDIVMPYGTALNSLKATFTASAGATVKIGTTSQTSGTTSNDFSSTKVYTVVAANGMTQNYTVNLISPIFSPITIIDSSSLNVGRSSSMDIVYGKPAIAYYDSYHNQIKFATAWNNDATSWNTPQIIDGNINYEASITLKVIQGNPAILYVKNGFLTYIRANNYDGSSWGAPVIIEKIGVTALNMNLEIRASLEIVNGKPAITYRNHNDYKLKIIRANNEIGSSWGQPIVINNAKGGFYPEMKIVKGYPAIVFSDSARYLYYVRSNDSLGINWGSPIILCDMPNEVAGNTNGHSSGLFFYPSLNIINGKPSISFYKSGKISLLKSLDDIGSSWNTNDLKNIYSTNTPRTYLTVLNGIPAIISSSYICDKSSGQSFSIIYSNDINGDTWGNVTILDTFSLGYCSILLTNSNLFISYSQNSALSYNSHLVCTRINLSSNDITAFSFSNPNATGSISGTNISVTVPYGTDVSKLTANFSAPNAKSVTVNNVAQTSGVSPLNFSTSQQYVVTGQDNTTKTFTVTVNVTPANTSKSITAFSFNGLNPVVTGTISGTNITATVPYGTNVSNLVATFTLSNFASAKVNGNPQVSGTTSNDFSASKVYTITAQDGSTQNYTVTVTIAPPKSIEKAITAFSFNGLNPIVTATISGTNITATVPFGTNVSNLAPTFTISSKATIASQGITQVSGVTVGDFTSSKTYVVTAENGTTQTYSVTLTIAKNTEKAITEFRFEGITPKVIGKIQGTTITAIVPNATNLQSLVATFYSSEKSTVKVGNIAQISGTTINDFTNPITYVVTAEDGSIQIYTVTITLARPEAPIVISPNPICEGKSIPNLVAKGTAIKWYSDAGLTNVVATDTSFKTGIISAGIYSYYVTQTANGLESLPTLVTLTIYGIPASPVSGGDQITTEGSTIPNLAVSSPTEVSWYSDTLLADFLDTGSTYSTGKTLTGTYTFYATARVNGCTSIATAVKLTINTPPAAWTVVTPNATSANLYGVAAPSKTSNWAIGAGGVLVSNTGTTWSTATSGLTSDINAISFNGTNNGWAVGKSGKILQYDGTKWAAVTNSSFISLHSVCAVDATTAFAAGASGRLLKYTGGSWSTVSNKNVSDSLFAMSFAGISKGIIVGGSGTIMTFNGTAWSSTTQGTSSLYGVHLLDANTGWAVGAKGTILKYNGTSWTSVTSGVSTTLRSVYFTSPSNGYAVGNGGVILKYDGTSWTKVASGTTNNLYGVAFSDANTGWAVGAAGTIVAFKGVTNTVALPTVTPQSVCLGETTPALNAEGSNVVWYSDAAATVQVGTGNSFTPSLSAVGIYTFYVTQTLNSLKSLPVAVSLTIKAKPTAPVTGGNISIVAGSALTPLSASGSSLVWYSDSNLVNSIGTGNTFTPINPVLGVTKYYVTQTENGCVSAGSSVTLTVNKFKSSEKAITAFGFTGFISSDIIATINDTTITATVPVGTDVTKLRATFTTSAKSTVSIGSTPQTSGSNINDFTSSVTYTVTAEDGTTQDYVVIVTVGSAPKSSEKAITAFGFTGFTTQNITATIKDTTITATVPVGTDVTKLRATFTASAKATVSIGSIPQTSGSSINDFTQSVTYTVTAEDGTTQDYVVIVTVGSAPKSSEKAITAFGFTGFTTPNITATIQDTTITATVPVGTDVTKLRATFTTSAKSTVSIGSTVQTSGSSINDFKQSVTYTVTAEDGTTQDYVVIVTVGSAPKSSEKAITAFGFTGFSTTNIIATIKDTTITATVPVGTDVTKLVATFTASAKAKVSIGLITQISGSTANDFTKSVTYTVTAEDGTIQEYVVIVKVATNPNSSEKVINTFSFEGLTPVVVASVSGTNITATVPFGTDVTKLVATFSASAKAKVSIGLITQISGSTVNDFTKSVTYTVTAEDGTIQEYVVIVKVATNPNSSEKVINTFSFEGLTPVVVATVSGTNITATVPFGTDVTKLVATFIASAKAKVSVGLITQISGSTANDFTKSVTYIVTAEDGTVQEYVVTVTIDNNPLGIENLETSTFTVFPNPTSGNFYVEAESGTLALRVTDLHGRVVYQLENKTYTGEKLHIDLSRFGASTYLIHLTNNGRDQLRKIEVVR